jgi:hypothetical protein
MADGRINRRIRFSGKFSTQLHLEHFPFDHQTLYVMVAPFDLIGDRFTLTVNADRVGRSEYAFVSDWNIDSVAAKVTRRPREAANGESMLFVYEIEVSRRWTYYVWRALLPMTLLVIASMLVFWFEPTNLQPQISTALGILLSLVTFSFAIDFALPKVAYLTYLDKYALTSFCFVLGAIIAIAVIHVVLSRRGVDRALRLQWWLRRLFPAAYILTVSSFTIYSFVIWNIDRKKMEAPDPTAPKISSKISPTPARWLSTPV